MNRGETLGLVWMLAALAITAVVLSFDGLAEKLGYETISDRVWLKLQAWWYEGASFPWLALILPAGVSQQTVGLLIHFFAGLYRAKL
jgi:hypothetical protein